jgi:hypothetical protein
MNDTIQNHQSQHNQQLSPNPLGFLSNYPTATVKIYFKLFSIKPYFKVLYPTQSTIAKWTRYSRKTANESLKQLEEDGLISSDYRHAKSKVYFLNPIAYTDEYKYKLSAWCQLFYFSLSLICSKPAQADNVTQLTSKEVFILTSTYFGGSDYRGARFVPYKKKERVTPKEDMSMTLFPTALPQFNAEQLEQLSQYGQAAFNRAASRLKQKCAEGQPPKDAFTWCLAIARNYTEGEGQPKSYSPSFSKKAAQQPNKQSQPKEEWQDDYQSTADKLRDRRERIRAKAIGMNLDIEGRTTFELELMIKGYELAPLRERRREQPDDVSHNLSKKEAQEVNPEPLVSNEINQPYLSDDSEWEEVFEEPTCASW